MGSIPGWCWVKVIPNTLRMVVVAGCLTLSMKDELGNITGLPGVSIM